MPAQLAWGRYINHSALHFKGGFAVNLTRTFKNDEWRRLAVFDQQLRHVATWKLNQQQMDALVPSEPGTLHRCTDPYEEQFQRAPPVAMKPN